MILTYYEEAYIILCEILAPVLLISSVVLMLAAACTVRRRYKIITTPPTSLIEQLVTTKHLGHITQLTWQRLANKVREQERSCPPVLPISQYTVVRIEWYRDEGVVRFDRRINEHALYRVFSERHEAIALPRYNSLPQETMRLISWLQTQVKGQGNVFVSSWPSRAEARLALHYTAYKAVAERLAKRDTKGRGLDMSDRWVRVADKFKKDIVMGYKGTEVLPIKQRQRIFYELERFWSS